VHSLNEERGGTLEAIVARMTMVSRADHCARKRWPVLNLRIIALSATLPNAEDIAQWLRARERGSLICCGQETRPVKLNTHVLSYPNRKNPFLFVRSLFNEIHSVVRQYSDGCPSLVFCPTRKNCESVASKLADISGAPFWRSEKHKAELEDASKRVRNNGTLAYCISRGVCYHSAGLSASNRRSVEDSFRSGILAVCCTTTTLAQGVNLPARLVVVMSTQQWKGTKEGYVEYPRSTILQMIGRAGRPQFDDRAIGVIMTQQRTAHRYRADMSGGSIVESNLRPRLSDFLNSEIALGSVKSASDAFEWLKLTFYFVRSQRNPSKYGVSSGPSFEDDLRDKVALVLKQLRDAGMNEQSDDGKLCATDTGRLMSRYFLRFPTVRLFEAFVKASFTKKSSDKSDAKESTLQDLLWLLSKCDEVAEVGIRKTEKKILRAFSGRFPLPNSRGAMTAQKKCFQMLQARCEESAGFRFSDSGLARQMNQVVDNALRVLAGLAAYFKTKNLSHLATARMLEKCLRQKMWENSRFIAAQIRGIGSSTAKKLAGGKLSSFDAIEQASTAKIEVICGRKFPFGSNLKRNARTLLSGVLVLHASQTSVTDSDVTVTLVVRGRFEEGNSHEGKRKYRTHDLMVWMVASDALSPPAELLLHAVVKNPTRKHLTISHASFPSDRMEATLRCCLLCRDIVGADTQMMLSVGRVSMNGSSPPSKSHRRKLSATHNVSKKIEARQAYGNDAERVECRHTCKNKAVCGHLCCREGLQLVHRKRRRPSSTAEQRSFATSASDDLSRFSYDRSPSRGTFERASDGCPQKFQEKEEKSEYFEDTRKNRTKKRRHQHAETSRVSSALKLAAQKSKSSAFDSRAPPYLHEQTQNSWNIGDDHARGRTMTYPHYDSAASCTGISSSGYAGEQGSSSSDRRRHFSANERHVPRLQMPEYDARTTRYDDNLDCKGYFFNTRAQPTPARPKVSENSFQFTREFAAHPGRIFQRDRENYYASANDFGSTNRSDIVRPLPPSRVSHANDDPTTLWQSVTRNAHRSNFDRANGSSHRIAPQRRASLSNHMRVRKHAFADDFNTREAPEIKNPRFSDSTIGAAMRRMSQRGRPASARVISSEMMDFLEGL